MVVSKDTDPSCRTALHNFFVVIWGGGQVLAEKHLAGKQLQNAARARYLHRTTPHRMTIIPIQRGTQQERQQSEETPRNQNKTRKKQNNGANKTRANSSNSSSRLITSDFGRGRRSRENRCILVVHNTNTKRKTRETHFGNPRASSQIYKTQRRTR